MNCARTGHRNCTEHYGCRHGAATRETPPSRRVPVELGANVAVLRTKRLFGRPSDGSSPEFADEPLRSRLRIGAARTSDGDGLRIGQS